MLRSLYSGISGLRSHQTMLDVTGNNIANVNTTGFKSSAVQFEDTLSQVLRSGTQPGADAGGVNPAQIGLGVRISAITTSFTQGAAQQTGRASDLMISGDGFFAVRSGAEMLYTRAGAFDIDTRGRLVAASGSIVQGWAAVAGVVDAGGPVADLQLPLQGVSAAVATTTVRMTGNLPADAAAGTVLTRDVEIYDAEGASTLLTLTFTKDAAGWAVGDGVTDYGTMTFTDGALTSSPTITMGGITLDVAAMTGFANLTTATVAGQDGREAGTLISYGIGPDGTVSGTFSNGITETIARIALATFANPGGLEKTGGSTYRVGPASGAPSFAGPGADGVGALAGGYLEMSNVDLSQEFTNLIVAQRGFQANARIITTSDEVLQELTNLKR